MAERKKAVSNPAALTPRQGKSLRYVVGRNRHGEDSIAIDDLIVETWWSDLPRSHFQAVQTVSNLVGKKLLIKVDEGRYRATDAGNKLIDEANKLNMWQTAPSPSITNPKRRA
jgi:hypothetical protein